MTPEYLKSRVTDLLAEAADRRSQAEGSTGDLKKWIMGRAAFFDQCANEAQTEITGDAEAWVKGHHPDAVSAPYYVGETDTQGVGILTGDVDDLKLLGFGTTDAEAWFNAARKILLGPS